MKTTKEHRQHVRKWNAPVIDGRGKLGGVVSVTDLLDDIDTLESRLSEQAEKLANAHSEAKQRDAEIERLEGLLERAKAHIEIRDRDGSVIAGKWLSDYADLAKGSE